MTGEAGRELAIMGHIEVKGQRDVSEASREGEGARDEETA